MLLKPVYCGDPIAYATEGSEIRFALPPLSSDHIAAFRRATRTEHAQGIPGTFPTSFRWGEFQYMGQLQINLRELLHTEQEYEYVAPLVVGDRVVVRTRLKEQKERAGMRFIYMESEVFGNDELKVISRSTFVVRAGVVTKKGD